MVDCPDREGRPVHHLETSQFYRTSDLPKRFEYPSWFYGYGIQKPQEHPFYRTTSSDYGRYPPTIHTVPTSFFPKTQEFSATLAKAGMYRNYSLNTGLDASTC
ncbi:piercer of microtubule wall 1 protein [Cylas formicarius]|uniref:piercer of microtubule wall 1 protein n=1 Tax=Cylas formicarius TaxID=197179 RepID=UPI0029589ECF|nr:piercer of microtubule wall 1 protein [Cylas formicarius]XP_060526588.1 piercer of microtubule wall 1 protein [Cylas formicarius]XP_060526589.1 piercer of microtubule wall 1 protein [Cylas formicarius]